MNGMSPLLCACNNNHVSTINYLICNVYSKNNNNKQESNETKLFDINDTDDRGATALWLCCVNGNIASISLLFEKFGERIDVNKCDNNGMSPFYLS